MPISLHESVKRHSAFRAAFLHDRALPVQLPARRAGALPGRHARVPDQRTSLFATGAARLPAQRNLYLPPALRRLPRLRAAARAGQTIHGKPLAAARLGATRPSEDQPPTPAGQPRVLRSVSALSAHAPPGVVLQGLEAG